MIPFKKIFLKNHTEQEIFSPISERQLESYYLDNNTQIKRIKEKLRESKKIQKCNISYPKIFLAIKNTNWEKFGLVDSWIGLGEIIHYDWGEKYDQNSPNWEKIKEEFNEELYQRVSIENKKKKIDIFFSYLSGNWVYPETIRKIGELDIITINISLDDALYFWGYKKKSGLSGNAEIAPFFDINITTQKSVDVAKYVFVGANALFMPPGANPQHFYSHSKYIRNIPISFIGQKYGIRGEIIQKLLENGIPIVTFGKGWDNGEISVTQMREIYSKSIINLGFGYIGKGTGNIGLKGRDFEVPMSGGLYITTYNKDLAYCYDIGKEIECYHDLHDLYQKINKYLTNTTLAKKIGSAGMEKAIKSHKWSDRFSDLLNILKNTYSYLSLIL